MRLLLFLQYLSTLLGYRTLSEHPITLQSFMLWRTLLLSKLPTSRHAHHSTSDQHKLCDIRVAASSRLAQSAIAYSSLHSIRLTTSLHLERRHCISSALPRSDHLTEQSVVSTRSSAHPYPMLTDLRRTVNCYHCDATLEATSLPLGQTC